MFFLTFGKVTFEKDLKKVMEESLQIPEESTFKTEGTDSAENLSGPTSAVLEEESLGKQRPLAGAQQCT